MHVAKLSEDATRTNKTRQLAHSLTMFDNCVHPTPPLSNRIIRPIKGKISSYSTNETISKTPIQLSETVPKTTLQTYTFNF